jgi:hypothetical protein
MPVTMGEIMAEASRRGGHRLWALAVLLVMAGVLTGIPAGASASACRNWTGTQPPSPGSSNNNLRSVAVLSACNAWAVGSYFINGTNQDLIEHWNGRAWTQAPSPEPSASDNELFSVAAVSATNIWAVGTYNIPLNTRQTLVLHWNGTAWKQVASPSPGGSSDTDSELLSVAATSSANAWATGTFLNASHLIQTLTLHWNGTSWKHVASPNVPGTVDDILFAVSTTSKRNAWAVGNDSDTQGFLQTLALHWNGTAWKQVATPDPAGAAANNSLASVAVRSARNAWAVGLYNKGSTTQTLALHWTGTRWKQLASPSPNAFGNDLSSVTVISPHDVWAVGAVGGGSQTLAERWNGTSWKRVPSPDPGGSADVAVFSAVGASSSANIWAVGFYETGSAGTGFQNTLALHCC